MASASGSSIQGVSYNSRNEPNIARQRRYPSLPNWADSRTKSTRSSARRPPSRTNSEDHHTARAAGSIVQGVDYSSRNEPNIAGHRSYSLFPKIIRSRRLPAASNASVSRPQAFASSQSALSVIWRSFNMLYRPTLTPAWFFHAKFLGISP